MNRIITFIFSAALILIGSMPAGAQIGGDQAISGIPTSMSRNANTNLVTPIFINLNTERQLNVTLKAKALNSNSTYTVYFSKCTFAGTTNYMETTPTYSASLTCTNTGPTVTNVNIDVGGAAGVWVFGQTNALDITTNIECIITHTFKNGG